MKCPLCGMEFEDPDIASCSGCGSFRTCTMQRCPNCGYEMVQEPGLVKFIRGLLR